MARCLIRSARLSFASKPSEAQVCVGAGCMPDAACPADDGQTTPQAFRQAQLLNTLPKSCLPWCAWQNSTISWSRKCTWRKLCNGCDECESHQFLHMATMGILDSDGEPDWSVVAALVAEVGAQTVPET